MSSWPCFKRKSHSWSCWLEAFAKPFSLEMGFSFKKTVRKYQLFVRSSILFCYDLESLLTNKSAHIKMRVKKTAEITIFPISLTQQVGGWWAGGVPCWHKVNNFAVPSTDIFSTLLVFKGKGTQQQWLQRTQESEHYWASNYNPQSLVIFLPKKTQVDQQRSTLSLSVYLFDFCLKKTCWHIPWRDSFLYTSLLFWSKRN